MNETIKAAGIDLEKASKEVSAAIEANDYRALADAILHAAVAIGSMWRHEWNNRRTN